jgi:hypothetical protein
VRDRAPLVAFAYESGPVRPGRRWGAVLCRTTNSVASSTRGLSASSSAIAVHERRVAMGHAPEGEPFRCG